MIDFKTAYEETERLEKELEATKPPPTLEQQVHSLTEQVTSLREELKGHLQPLQPRLVRSRMTRAEQVAYIKQHGREKYLALPWDVQPKKRTL